MKRSQAYTEGLTGQAISIVIGITMSVYYGGAIGLAVGYAIYVLVDIRQYVRELHKGSDET